MGRKFQVLLAFMWVFLTACYAYAGDQVQNISRGKKATALVVIDQPGRKANATAFCVDTSGVFVTNNHVVERGGENIKLVLNAGESNQEIVAAKVLRIDKEHDLALLRIDSKTKLTVLELGTVDNLVETAPLTAFGYPFGMALSEKDEYPNITVTTGRITSFRRVRGELQHIQLDASLNPGNSGGPVIDENGKVVGIVTSGIMGSGVNFAVPVSRLTTFLSKPEISFVPPVINQKNQYDLLDFKVQVMAMGIPQSSIVVELTLTGSDGLDRILQTAADAQGEYHFKITPLVRPGSNRDVKLTINYSGGTITGKAHDLVLQGGNRTMKLSEIAQIDPAKANGTQLKDRSVIDGKLSGLEAVEVSLGEVNCRLDLSKAQSIQVGDVANNSAVVNYRLVVKNGTKDLGQTSGVITINGGSSSVAGGFGLLRPVQLSGDKETLKLPATVDDVVAGGGGRYLLLLMNKVHKIAVFDVSQTKIVRYISVGDDNVEMAAGATKLVLAKNNSGVIQRYDLQTGECELTQPLMEEVRNRHFAMGWSSTGPILIGNGKLLDVKTLKVIESNVDSSNRNGMAYAQIDSNMIVRASGDGTTFGLWRMNTSPSGIFVAQVEGTRINWNYQHDSAGMICPSYDGSMLLTFRGPIKSNTVRDDVMNSNSANRNWSGGQAIPAYHPNYFLAFNNMSPMDMARRNGPRKSDLMIYSLEDRRLLLTVNDVAEFAPPENYYPNQQGILSMDKRVHFIPMANVLITLGDGLDQLVIRKLNIIEAMDQAGIDYILVTSLPNRTATPGQKYSYQVQVAAKKGGVQYKLESGPDGMQMDRTGNVTWNVPADIKDSQVGVIISAHDAVGQEVMHSFNIMLK